MCLIRVKFYDGKLLLKVQALSKIINELLAESFNEDKHPPALCRASTVSDEVLSTLEHSGVTFMFKLNCSSLICQWSAKE